MKLLTLTHEHRLIIWGFGITALVFLVAGVLGTLQIISLSSKVSALEATSTALAINLASSTQNLQVSINQSQALLLGNMSANFAAVQSQLGGVQGQVGNLSGTLTTLQKLSATDPELLKKYSKVYFLNENYVPARLSQIPLTYQYTDTKQLLIESDVLPRLQSMIDSASSTGIKLYVNSAYRSFAEQRALKGDYSMTYGAGTANSFSADQGYSEHQLGTAVDMTTVGLNGGLNGFEKTPAYLWMVQNAYQYGFILSYPPNNGYYVFEPWHWRFVGVKLATDIHNQNTTFYSMDQRTIDTYLVSIFD